MKNFIFHILEGGYLMKYVQEKKSDKKVEDKKQIRLNKKQESANRINILYNW